MSNPLPVMLTTVPPGFDPLVGQAAFMRTCAWYRYGRPVPESGSLTAFFTCTLTTLPALPAGTTHRMLEAFTTSPGTFKLPNRHPPDTPTPDVNDPTIVTMLPPEVGPWLG